MQSGLCGVWRSSLCYETVVHTKKRNLNTVTTSGRKLRHTKTPFISREEISSPPIYSSFTTDHSTVYVTRLNTSSEHKVF